MTTKTIARWVTISALFIIPFLSLYVSNGSYFPFITGKNFFFRILVEIAVAGWVVLAIADRRYRPRFSWTYVWYKSFVFWMLLAALFAVNTHKALWSNYERMDGWVTLVHLLFFMVVLSAVLGTENLWRKWWLAFIGSSALVTVYGVFQLLGAAATHQGNRVDASLGNAEYLAGYLLFAVAITLWQALETRQKELTWLRYSLFTLAAVQVIIMFATGTRGTLVGLVAGAAVGSALWMFEAGKQGRKGAAVVLGILILLVGGLFIARESAFVTQNPTLQRFASIFSLRESLGTRTTIWSMAVEGIKDKPLLGWGQEGYNYIFNTYYEPSLYAQEPWFDRAHNLFLDWAVAGGIPALLLFVATLVTAVLALYRSSISRPQRILLLSALAGYSVQGLVVFDNLFTYIPFVAILAMAHTVSSRPIPMFDRAREVNDSRLDTLVAPGALVVGLVIVWIVNVPSVFASSNLIAGLTPTSPPQARFEAFKSAVANNGLAHQEISEQFLSFASSIPADAAGSTIQQDVISFAKEQMERELEIAPADARLHLQYAIFLRTIGDTEGAQKESALARQYSPKKQAIILEQGIEAFVSKDYAAAKTFFLQAYQLDTKNTDPIGYAAAAEIASGNAAGGRALLQQTFGTTSVNHPLLTFAYYQTKDWNGLIETIRAKLRETNDAATSFQLAAAYSEAGRRDEAIAQVRATIAAFPEGAAQGAAYLQQLGVTQ